MKNIKLAAIVAVVSAIPAAAALAEAPAQDAATRIQVFMPQRSEDWTTGSGVEMQARFWSSKSFGTALCLGFNSWTAKNEFSESSDDESVVTTSVYGNMTLVPVGASALYRNCISEQVAVTLEVGMRYILTRSHINAEITSEDAEGTSCFRDRILTDSTFVGVVGINVETELAEDMSFHLGFGYQFDLGAPRETFSGEDIGSTSFSSPMVNIGISWAF